MLTCDFASSEVLHGNASICFAKLVIKSANCPPISFLAAFSAEILSKYNLVVREIRIKSHYSHHISISVHAADRCSAVSTVFRPVPSVSQVPASNPGELNQLCYLCTAKQNRKLQCCCLVLCRPCPVSCLMFKTTRVCSVYIALRADGRKTIDHLLS
jgi:hypothetical protein